MDLFTTAVGRNKQVRAAARTCVSGKHHPNPPETPPRATRLDGLIPAYAQLRFLGLLLMTAKLALYYAAPD